jgi:ubiquinone/menaquinone biosynthesis C-methylase UbiE
MGFYQKYILPRIVNRMLSTSDCLEQRQRVTQGLRGNVLEIGFGSGLNLPCYPDEVTKLYAVDPDLTGRKMAAARLAACRIPVEFTGLDGQKLPLESDSMDAVLSTWTLCTIPDLPKALSEISRVLKPAGRLHFLEHGLSPDAKVARWQNRLNGLQQIIGGGCNLNRKIDDLLRDSGYEIIEAENFYMKGPKIGTYMYKGVAVSPA